jgi:hypothetical protein
VLSFVAFHKAPRWGECCSQMIRVSSGGKQNKHNDAG